MCVEGDTQCLEFETSGDCESTVVGLIMVMQKIREHKRGTSLNCKITAQGQSRYLNINKEDRGETASMH